MFGLAAAEDVIAIGVLGIEDGAGLVEDALGLGHQGGGVVVGDGVAERLLSCDARLDRR